MENGDRMRLKLKKNEDFDIRSFYIVLRGSFYVVFSWKGMSSFLEKVFRKLRPLDKFLFLFQPQLGIRILLVVTKV